MTEQNPLPGAPDFAAALAAALSTGESSGYRSLEQCPAPAAPALHFALTLEGDLTGGCFVAITQEDAAALSADDDPAQALQTLLETAGGEAASRLLPNGTVSVQARRMEELPAEVTPVGGIATRPEAARQATFALFFDPQLLAALPQRATPAAPPALPVDSGDILNGNLGLVMDVELKVTLRFGRRQMPLREVLDLASGSVVELDRQVDEPVELILEGKVIARGEAVIVDGNYGIRVTEVLQGIPA